MLNVVALEGRLTADPELRHTANDIAVANFTLAVDRSRKNKDGEREADFIDVTAWRGTAEMVCKYFSKGRLCIVEGCFEQQRFTDKNGNKRSKIVVVARSVHFAGDSKKSGSSGNSSESKPAEESNTPETSAGNNSDYVDIGDDGDLPF